MEDTIVNNDENQNDEQSTAPAGDESSTDSDNNENNEESTESTPQPTEGENNA
jgi:hypothetical protein